MNPERITVVTGFARSGASLMMRMLYLAGVPVVADNHLSFECAMATRGKMVKQFQKPQLHLDRGWVATCRGKAVKILEPMRFILPTGFDYDFIVMHRTPIEQARSQIKFLKYVVGMPVKESDAPKLARRIIADTPAVKQMLSLYPGSRQLDVNFERVLDNPLVEITLVLGFLDQIEHMDVIQKRSAVLPRCSDSVVKRDPKCYAGFLELQLEDLP